jgi:hypothetical protein
MTERHVGRLLVAALHQALAEELPPRLDFYEHWLKSETLREGALHVASLSAVLGFLRREEAYDRVVARAGTLAAEWAVASLPSARRRLIGWLPRRWRTGAALGVARATARLMGHETDLRGRREGERVKVEVRHSLFCETRTLHPGPLCGFYAALVARTLTCFDVDAIGRPSTCRAAGGATCTIDVDLSGSAAAPSSFEAA